MTKLECVLVDADALITSKLAKVCGCIRAQPGLPHQRTRPETSDACRRQLNQASWNGTVLKFRSESQWDVRNYFSCFLWFSLDRTIWKKARQDQFDSGLPDWLFWRHISQIWLFLEAVGVKKLFGFLAFSFQYLAFFGGSWQILPDLCFGFLNIILKSVSRLF